MTNNLLRKGSAKIFLLTLLVFNISKTESQTICNASGNLMLYTNYDGGTLTINVDQNIPNLHIGVCSYEGTKVILTGAFLSNVVAVRYAGYNGNNAHCGSPTASINTNISGQAVSTTTSIAIMPPSPLANTNGYSSIICGYSCSNNTSQGGCNTVDQIEAYFLNYFSNTSLYAHKVQYGCWSGTQSVSIGGNCCPPLPVIPGVVATSQSICAGQTPAAFTSSTLATGGSGPITYTWQSSTTSTNSGFTNMASANSTTYAAGALLTTTYFRRAASTATNNVAYSNVITVTVVPYPVVSVSGQTNVCFGNSTTLTASGGTAYNWQPSNINGPTVVISPTTTAMFTLVCPPGGACVTTMTISVVVVPPPVVSVLVPAPVCQGQSLSITPSGATNYTLIPGNITSNPLVFNPAVSGNYTVFGENSGCVNSATVPVTVLQLPTVAATASQTLACSGQSLSLSAAGAQNYVWEPGSTSSNPYVITIQNPETYTLTGTDANGCTNSVTIAIGIAPLPTVVITPSVSTICSGKTATFTASGATNYTWMPGNLNGITATLSPGATTAFTITGESGCSNTVTQLVTVDPSPTITIVASKSVICNGQSSTLTPSGAASYTWTGVSTTTGASAVVSPTATTAFSVTGLAGNGCDNSSAYSLTVLACLGISSLNPESGQGIAVFPNPNKGEFIIKTNDAVKLNIIDSQGRFYGSYELNALNNYEVKVNHLKTGLYFIVSNQEKDSRDKKVLIIE